MHSLDYCINSCTCLLISGLIPITPSFSFPLTHQTHCCQIGLAQMKMWSPYIPDQILLMTLCSLKSKVPLWCAKPSWCSPCLALLFYSCCPLPPGNPELFMAPGTGWVLSSSLCLPLWHPTPLVPLPHCSSFRSQLSPFSLKPALLFLGSQRLLLGYYHHHSLEYPSIKTFSPF